MASSMSDDGIDGKGRNSDNSNSVCDSKDVNEFSQVTNVIIYLPVAHVMDKR